MPHPPSSIGLTLIFCRPRSTSQMRHHGEPRPPSLYRFGDGASRKQAPRPVFFAPSEFRFLDL